MTTELPELHKAIQAPEGLSIGRRWTIEGPEADRIRFRGVRPGEAFTVRDASGEWFRARLHLVQASEGLTGEAFEAISSPESPLPLVLLQAVPARERMFWVVQKATELGAHWILPIFTARSLAPSELEREKAHAWPAAIRRAVAQCRRGSVPVLLPAMPLVEALAHELWAMAEVRWALVERPTPPAPLPAGKGESMGAGGLGALLVGPEGGWTGAELAMIDEAGGTQVSLGNRILRTETAAIVGLTLLQHLYGDLRR
jgi:16S rRNA (uracil1498-N3)-methyltransferase